MAEHIVDDHIAQLMRYYVNQGEIRDALKWAEEQKQGVRKWRKYQGTSKSKRRSSPDSVPN